MQPKIPFRRTYVVLDRIKAHGWTICADPEGYQILAYPTYKELKLRLKDLKDRHDPFLPPEVTDLMDFYILSVNLGIEPDGIKVIVRAGE